MSGWDVRGRVCLVTGATCGIGRAITAELAGRGARILAVARDQARGEQALAGLAGDIRIVPCDLARMSQVRQLALCAPQVHGQLDVVINNAAVSKWSRELTEGGLETTFAVNHLAPFLLTNLVLDPAGPTAPPTRIITVSSSGYAHAPPVDFDDLQSARSFKPLQVYQRTKLMNVWFTQVLAQRLAGTGAIANCADPGFARTRLAREARGPFAVFIRLAGPFQDAPEKACDTAVYLAADPGCGAASGQFFAKRKALPLTGAALDDQAAQRLWDISARLCGIPDRGPVT
jgi:NAD(P)-dependent dehydrogenase (short-subunit alcohol dehydrogenase family)